MTSTEYLARVDRTAGPDRCWIAPTGGADGYAVAYLSDQHRQIRVARWVLAEKLGRPIGEGLMALHTCDNRRCVNPAHIYEGTAADNGRDKAVRGRARNSYTKFTLGRVSVNGEEAA